MKLQATNAGRDEPREVREGTERRVAQPRSWVMKMIPRVSNAMLWLVSCGMAATGLLLAFRLPPGREGGKGLSVMGWDRHEWGDLHTWMGYVIMGLILVHLALHWRWLWQVAAKKHRWPLLLGFGLGFAMIVTLLAWPVSHPEERESSRPKQHRQAR